MIKNRQKNANKWRVEMDRVEAFRRIMLLTAYLQEMEDYAELKLSKIAA